jgi:succinyl-CoA synthetase beta subunit
MGDTNTTSFLLGRLGLLAQAGVSTLAQAQAKQNAAGAARKAKAGCSPCAAKAQVAAARARVKAGRL